MASEDNKELCEEELEALTSIYGDELVVLSPTSFVVPIRPACSIPADETEPLLATFEFVEGYPNDCAPKVTLSASWLAADKAEEAIAKLEEEEYEAGIGCVFGWIEWLRDNVLTFAMVPLDSVRQIAPAPVAADDETDTPAAPAGATPTPYQAPTIYHGSPIKDRKSKFIAHLAFVSSAEEVEAVMDELYKDKRVANATHNVLAYRYKPRDSPLIEMRDDDGENKAGDQLLSLLQRLGVRDVVVVVTRWYGGVHLGPDRFRHILNAAQNLLIEQGVIEGEASVSGASSGTAANNEDATTGKRYLRPADIVYKRIVHDPQLDEDDFVIGYEDRFTGIQEVAFKDYQVDDVYAYEGIPFHRIRFYKQNGTIVWDRRDRTDLLYHPEDDEAAAAAAAGDA